MKEYQGICTILRAATLPLSIVHIMPSDPGKTPSLSATLAPLRFLQFFFFLLQY